MKRGEYALATTTREVVQYLDHYSKAALLEMVADLAAAARGHAGDPCTVAEIADCAEPVARGRGDRIVPRDIGARLLQRYLAQRERAEQLAREWAGRAKTDGTIRLDDSKGGQR